MKTLDQTIFGRALGWLARQVCRHPAWFLWPQLLLFIGSVVYTAKYLQFDPSRDNLVGSGKKYHQNFLKFKAEFPEQDDLVVIVESDDLEKNRQFVERLGAKLEVDKYRQTNVVKGVQQVVETNLFVDVFYKGDLKMMGPKALLFVPEEDLKQLRDTLGDFVPAIEKFTQATNLNSLMATINSQFLHAKREQNKETDALMKALPMVGRILTQATASLHRTGVPPSPGVEALFSAGEEAQEQIYITFAHGRLFLVTAHAPTEDLNDQAVERMRELVAETQREVPGLNVGLTGESVLEHDEMAQSQADSTLASIVSLVVCALIFIYGYQEIGRPLKATLCLLVGLGYTMAFTTFTVGHLNILTITFVPILIGLAIDFGVHVITRYEEELRLGKTEEVAIGLAIVFTGQGVFTGALTTAAAFLAMCLTDFRGIQEMGIICGGGMLICLVPMLTLLPVLLLRSRRNQAGERPTAHAAAAPVSFRARLESLWLDRPRLICCLTVILSGLAVTQFHKVFFDYNLLNMQSAGLPAVKYEKKLIDSTSQSVLFAAVVADSAQEAVELEKKLRALPAVSTNFMMASYLTEDQTQKLRLIGQIKQQVAGLHFAPVALPPSPRVETPRSPLGPKPEVPAADPAAGQAEEYLAALGRTLFSTKGYFGAAAAETAQEADQAVLTKQLRELRDSVRELHRQLNAGPPELMAQKLAAFERALFDDVRETFDSFRNQDNRAPLRAEDLPAAFRHRFIGITGKYLIQVYPRENIWNREQQTEFIRQVRTVAPLVTGTPVQLYEYTTLLKESYQLAAWYALLAIILMVWVHFRNFKSVVLALLPVGIGVVWLGGFMGLTAIPFNPANIMTLPLVIGIGVTNGIHILNRYAEEGNPNLLSKSTGKAVFVSGLTTISGFGSLMLAKHQGIQSLGYVMSLGVTACMLAALTFLPAILNLFPSQSPAQRPGADNARSAPGPEEPRSQPQDK